MQLLDLDSWYQTILATWRGASDVLWAYAPRVLLALVVLAVGWLLARSAQAIGRVLLRKAGIDKLTASRVGESLRTAGITAPLSTVAARILFWALWLAFGLFALQALGIRAVGATLEKVIGFLPSLFAVAVIMAVGIPLARLARNLTASTAAAAGVSQAGRLGAAAQVAISLLLVVLSLGQLGVQTELLVTVITTLVATIGLSMGLAFALGARPIVTHILAGHFLRQSLARGTQVEVLGKAGEVRSVGAVSTVLGTREREWLVPNEKVLNEVLGR